MNKFKLSLSSLRVRLTLWYVFVLTIILVVFSVVVYNAIRISQFRGLETGLFATAEILANKLESSGAALFSIEPSELPSGEETFFQIVNLQGQIQVRSGNLTEFNLPLKEGAQIAAFRDQTYLENVTLPNSSDVRMLTQGVRLFGFGVITNILQVGVSFDQVEKNLEQLRFWLWIIVPFTLALTSAVGVFLADRLLRPLAQIISSAQEISSRSLNRRLPVPSESNELGKLAATLNDLFDRLEKAFKNQQRFIADASHELRTPMAAMRAEIEVALRRARSNEEYLTLIRSNLDEVERLSRMAERLLFLAQSDAGELPLRGQQVRLDLLCHRVVEKLELLAGKKNIALSFKRDAEVLVQGDDQLLEQLIVILVENALKYSPADQRVQLFCGVEPDAVWLTVTDTGPGIAQEHIPHLFDRFYRVDKARSRQFGGVGLGLSIARSIVTAYGGKIEVQSQLGQGTTFRVVFPGHSTRV